MKKTIIFFAAIVAVILLVMQFSSKAQILALRLLPGFPAVVKSYSVPEPTKWKPVGPRLYSRDTNINSQQASFGRSLHTDVHGSDEIALAVPSMFKEEWTAETDMFLAEGPVFDKRGNIYFCPILPKGNELVVAIEPEKGARRWAIQRFSFGCGTPLVLENPESREDILYVASYDLAMAVDTDGNILWEVETGLPKLDPKKIEAEKHSFGMNYIAKYDALIGVLGDGYVYLLDRKTGRALLEKPYMLPGAKNKPLSKALPADIMQKAREDSKHLFIGNGEIDVLTPVLTTVTGENQKVTNNFSIDSNSGRIWIAATVDDEQDGVKDGWSESAALYGIDIQPGETFLELKIASVTEVPGGTASTPAVRADGKRVYIANAFDTVYAVDAENGKIIWSQAVGDKVTGSLVVSADNGEIFANTKASIVKLIDRGSSGELDWISNLNMFKPGLMQANFNMLGAELAANGIAFFASVGFMAGNLRLPFQVGAGFMDRETGEIKYFIEGADDSVSSTVTGPTGEIYNGNSPLRRVLARSIIGKHASPKAVRGGVTKFKASNEQIMVRDIILACRNRAENTITLSDTNAIHQDKRHIQLLLNQSVEYLNRLVKKGNAQSTGFQHILNTVLGLQNKMESDRLPLENLINELKRLKI